MNIINDAIASVPDPEREAREKATRENAFRQLLAMAAKDAKNLRPKLIQLFNVCHDAVVNATRAAETDSDDDVDDEPGDKVKLSSMFMRLPRKSVSQVLTIYCLCTYPTSPLDLSGLL